MERVLAIDLGASSGRAIMCTLKDGKIQLEELHRFSNDPVMVNGTLYWDTLRLFHEIKQGIIKGQLAGGFNSLGIDTWGCDFALMDAHGHMLENPVHYRDTRTESMPELLAKVMSDEELYQRTGIQKMTLNTLYQLYALKQQRPELLERTHTVLLTPDFLNYLLTGNRFTEYTIASTSELCDPRTRDWDWELIDKAGLPHSFTEIREPGFVVGTLTESLCEELSVEPAKVVAIASHDTASAVAAVPSVDGEKYMYISSGTWSLMGAETQKSVMNEAAVRYNLTNEGGYGGTVRLLKNIMGLWLIQESRRRWQKEGQDYSFAQLVEMAIQAPSFQCLFDVDASELFTPGNIPRRIRSMCEGTKPETPGAMARAIFENLALRYRRCMEEVQEATGEIYQTLHIVGGGANNKMLNQFTANATGMKVVAGPAEATVLGNAAVQWLASGAIGSLKEAREIIARSQELETFMPQDGPAWQAAYDQYINFINRR